MVTLCLSTKAELIICTLLNKYSSRMFLNLFVKLFAASHRLSLFDILRGLLGHMY